MFLDRSTILHAREHTYFLYNTVKYLIGITPQGTVSFISEGWGDRTSELGATQPIDFLMFVNNEETTQDKIVHVSCALINICDSVVPFD